MIEINFKKPTDIRTGQRRFRSDPRDYYLGKSRWNDKVDLYLPYEALYKNVMLIAPPGGGKSTTTEDMGMHYHRFGPVIHIDWHGDAVEHIRSRYTQIPEMAKKFIYVDFSNLKDICGINPMHLSHQLLSEKISSLIQVVASHMGQNIEDTPRVNRVLSAIFGVTLMNNCTMYETKYLASITDNPIKTKLVAQIEDEYYKEQFKLLSKLRLTEKLNQMESSINRLFNFTGSEVLSLSFGTQNAINWDRIIDENIYIAFNCKQSGTISAEQARLVCGLVLMDLIACLRARPPEKRPRDVVVIADEIPAYINPFISESFTLDRKHSLRWIVNFQSVHQIKDIDPYIFHNMMAGCQSKILWGNLPWADLEELEKDIFAGQHDIMKVKNKIHQRKIMNYLEQTRIVRSSSDANTEVSSWFSADGEMEVDSVAQSRGEVRFSGMSSADVTNPNAGFFIDPTISHTEGISAGISEQFSEMEGHSQGKSHVSGEGGATGSSHTEGQSEVPFLKPVFGSELSSIERVSLDEQRYMNCVKLKRMPERTCCLKILSAPPLFVKIKPIRTYQPSEQQLEKFNQLMYNSHNCFSKREAIEAEIAARHERLLKQTNSSQDSNSFFED